MSSPPPTNPGELSSVDTSRQAGAVPTSTPAVSAVWGGIPPTQARPKRWVCGRARPRGMPTPPVPCKTVAAASVLPQVNQASRVSQRLNLRVSFPLSGCKQRAQASSVGTFAPPSGARPCCEQPKNRDGRPERFQRATTSGVLRGVRPAMPESGLGSPKYCEILCARQRSRRCAANADYRTQLPSCCLA